MSKKYSYKEVKHFFKSNGCELLEKEYINSKTMMKYKCSCGNISTTNYTRFQQGLRCKECAKIRRIETNKEKHGCANVRKHTYEYVKKFFEEQGCTLLSEKYDGNDKKLNYICSCGNESVNVTFATFKKGTRCNECAKKRRISTNNKKYGCDNPMQNREIQEKFENIMIERYGVRNCSQNIEVLEKTRKTNIERYGVPYLAQNEEIRKKQIDRCMEIYGVDNPFKSEIIKEKIKKTSLGKYGYENPMQNLEIQEKMKKTMMDKYGVENSMQLEETKEKARKTNLEKRGVESAMQDSLIFEKNKNSCYSRKIYILPSGKEVTYQGYEDYCLDDLLEEIDEEDIIHKSSEMPTIKYIFDGKNRSYFPDFYIPTQNKFIEVKSKYTLYAKLEENIAKFSAVVNEGYYIEVRLYDKYGQYTIYYSNEF